MFKKQEVVEFPEEIVIHICKFAAEPEPEPDCEVVVRQQQPSQRARKKRSGTLNLSKRDGK